MIEINSQARFEPYISDRLPQDEKILLWLKSGRSLTPLEALERFQCLRLGARAWDLRRKGVNVRSRIIETRGKKHVAEYYIPVDKPLIAPSERKKKSKSITLDRLRELAHEIANGDLTTELIFSRLVSAVEEKG